MVPLFFFLSVHAKIEALLRNDSDGSLTWLLPNNLSEHNNASLGEIASVSSCCEKDIFLDGPDGKWTRGPGTGSPTLLPPPPTPPTELISYRLCFLASPSLSSGSTSCRLPPIPPHTLDALSSTCFIPSPPPPPIPRPLPLPTHL